MDSERLRRAAKNTEAVQAGVRLGEQALVIDNIEALSEQGNYRNLASVFDKAMKHWGVLEDGTGYVDGKLISDTGEICFDPQNARFEVRTEHCAFFSGAPEESTVLSERITAKIKNDRISISLMAADQKELCGAKEFLITAMGRTGTDQTAFTPGPDFMGIPITVVTFAGKLYAETLEGELLVKAKRAKLEILDPVGNVLAVLHGDSAGESIVFKLTGEIPGVQYKLTTE